MRTLGDLGWINDYVGIPYVSLGRTRRGVDCYGLIKLVYEQEYGEELPDWHPDSHFNLQDRGKTIEQIVTSGEFTEVEHPKDGDIAVCYRTKAAYHLGLYFGGGVLHAAEGVGVVYEPRRRFDAMFVKVVYGEWRP